MATTGSPLIADRWSARFFGAPALDGLDGGGGVVSLAVVVLLGAGGVAGGGASLEL